MDSVQHSPARRPAGVRGGYAIIRGLPASPPCPFPRALRPARLPPARLVPGAAPVRRGGRDAAASCAIPPGHARGLVGGDPAAHAGHGARPGRAGHGARRRRRRRAGVAVLFATVSCALLIQIGTNLYNDAIDFERGTDRPERLGPLRVTLAGWASAAEVKRGALLCLLLALLLGAWLCVVGGALILAIGWPPLMAGWAYSGGPADLALAARRALRAALLRRVRGARQPLAAVARARPPDLLAGLAVGAPPPRCCWSTTIATSPATCAPGVAPRHAARRRGRAPPSRCWCCCPSHADPDRRERRAGAILGLRRAALAPLVGASVVTEGGWRSTPCWSTPRAPVRGPVCSPRPASSSSPAIVDRTDEHRRPAPRRPRLHHVLGRLALQGRISTACSCARARC